MKIQDTVELTLPESGKKIVLRGRANARVKEEIRRVLLRDNPITFTADGKPIQREMVYSRSAIIDSNYKAVELMVLEFDGSKEDILDRVLDELSDDDYTALKNKIDEVSAPLAKKSDSGSSTATTTP